ncbi:MAG: sigma-70 family RNA polymerase sigma factor [Muribaculaceae bacterium]|nr:sigma-70 family RNA polymerase sigma factor [Muribaculaceae bacterium]
MRQTGDKEQQFLDILGQYKDVVTKVCWLYADREAAFDDLYQETCINIWQGMNSFRGDARMSTWIYRTAINTCISWHRRNRRHSDNSSIDNLKFEPVSDDKASDIAEEYRELHRLISMLGPMDKAMITLWLDEKSYEEIALIVGMSLSNVAVKLHRIKERLTKLADNGR